MREQTHSSAPPYGVVPGKLHNTSLIEVLVHIGEKLQKSRDFPNLLLIPISYHSGSFAKREKGGNRLVPDPDYMVDALKFPNQALRVSGESLQTCVTWRCPDGTHHLFYWPILVNR
ncbi:hypothetical protein TNCV_2838291 [Trichonephila clavipes]|nr:hypothetical protein TNCV_2838291 [Trichonephila clavipes]